MTTMGKIVFFAFLLVVIIIFTLSGSLILRFVTRKIGKQEKKVSTKERRLAIAIHAKAVLGLLCFGWAYFLEPYRLQVTSVIVKTTGLLKTSFRIIQISDLHCDEKIRNEPRLAEIINRLKPDIIVFTGDAVNAPAALPIFRKTLASLNAGIGKFAVSGNWDLRYPNKKNTDMLFDDTGFKRLELETVRVKKNGEEIYITGTPFGNRVDYARKVLDAVPPEKFSVYLYHAPDHAEDLGGLNVDLYMCGHTHGGQVCLPLYGAFTTLSRFGKKYESGRYEIDGMTLYVNRGIGMEGGHMPRVRFWCPPEITVFDVTPQNG